MYDKVSKNKLLHNICIILIVFFGLLIIFLPINSISLSDEFLAVTKDYRLKIPDDLYFKKDYRIQWWYLTGHLYDEEGREFGYELTFFAVNVQKKKYKSKFGVNRIYISHFGLTDVLNKKFYFSEKADSGAFGFAEMSENELNLRIDKNSLKYNIIHGFHIKAHDKEKAIELQLQPLKSVVLHGENGYFRKSEESPSVASYYFSYTNLYTYGTIKIKNNIFKVKGTSWFDREFFTEFIGTQLSGWDWFSIKLNDKREIMLYIFRRKDGSVDIHSSGTLVYSDSRTRHLTLKEFSITPLSFYISKKTKAKYPSEWKIRIPSESINIKITPLVKEQEVLAYKTTGNYYWEGTCKVEGSSNGRAYVEMTGY